MYSGLDRVSLFGIESDVKPEKITASYNSSQTDDLPVTSVGIFTAFENYPVDGNNPGYVKLGQEIIRYTGVSTSNGTITGITRAIDDTKSGDYSENEVVFKYELNGVSLRRINCEHSFESTDLSKYPLDIDHYWVKVGVSSRGTDRGVTHLFQHFILMKLSLLDLMRINILSSVLRMFLEQLRTFHSTL